MPHRQSIGRFAAYGLAGFAAALVVAPALHIDRPAIAGLFDAQSLAIFTRSIVASIISTAIAVVIGLRVGTYLANPNCPRVVRLLIDCPIVLPPIVVGIGLLLLFRGPLRSVDESVGIVAEPVAIVLAQTAVAMSLASRLFQASLSRVSPRHTLVDRTLGRSPEQTWWAVSVGEARHSLVAAALVVWAQTFGTFGPVLVLAGITRGRTEIMPTSIYLELSSGEIGRAAALSASMVAAAAIAAAAATRIKT